MPTTDLSTEALLVRREIAEKATPGPWKPDESFVVSRHIKAITGDGPTDYVLLAWICPKPGEMGTHEQKANDAAHFAANSPDVVIDTIDEVLRLRAECARLERELVGAIDVMECLLAGKPGGVYFQKYQGGLQIALRSAQLGLSGAAHRAVEKGNE